MATYKYKGPDGKEYELDLNKENTNSFFGINNDGYRTNNHLRRGTSAELNKVIQWYMENGRTPTMDEFKDITGSKGAGYDNITRDLKTFKKTNNLSDEMIQGYKPYQPTLSENFTNMDREGTFANQIYQEYLNAGKAQNKADLSMIQQSEKDLAINQAMDRQKYIDEIRNKRRTMLKSGLSSAQLANDEAQTLLMSQSLSNQNARMFVEGKAQVQNNTMLNETNSRINARTALGGGLGANLGAINAGAAGDVNDAAIRYYQELKKNPAYKSSFKTASGT